MFVKLTLLGGRNTVLVNTTAISAVWPAETGSEVTLQNRQYPLHVRETLEDIERLLTTPPLVTT
jgi:hypothetical protein